MDKFSVHQSYVSIDLQGALWLYLSITDISDSGVCVRSGMTELVLHFRWMNSFFLSPLHRCFFRAVCGDNWKFQGILQIVSICFFSSLEKRLKNIVLVLEQNETVLKKTAMLILELSTRFQMFQYYQHRRSEIWLCASFLAGDVEIERVSTCVVVCTQEGMSSFICKRMWGRCWLRLALH